MSVIIAPLCYTALVKILILKAVIDLNLVVLCLLLLLPRAEPSCTLSYQLSYALGYHCTWLKAEKGGIRADWECEGNALFPPQSTVTICLLRAVR